MSKEELKHEINLVLDHFSADALQELLQFLRQLEQESLARRAPLLNKILAEDKELLQKLAQ